MRDGSREILCGLTYNQVIAFAGCTRREAAKKLGVSEGHFYTTIKELGMGHWFPFKRPKRERCLSRHDVAELAKEGYTQKDAAYIAGISYSYMLFLVSHYGLNDLFPNSGEGAAIARRGYACCK